MPGAVGAHPAVVEAEEVNALASLLQVHDPGLGVLELEPKLAQDLPQRQKRRVGLRPCPAHRQQIIREPDQNPVPALRPLPVKPMQVDVAQAGRNHTALRGSGHVPRTAPSSITPERSIARRSFRT